MKNKTIFAFRKIIAIENKISSEQSAVNTDHIVHTVFVCCLLIIRKYN